MDLSSMLGSIRIYKKGASRIHNKMCYFPFATYLENTIIDWQPNPLNQKLMCEGMAQTKVKELYWKPLWMKKNALIHAEACKMQVKKVSL